MQHVVTIYYTETPVKKKNEFETKIENFMHDCSMRIFYNKFIVLYWKI